MGTTAGDCNGGGIAGDLSGWGPLGEAFRLFESDGRKMVLGRAAGGAEVDRPLGTCSRCAIRPVNGNEPFSSVFAATRKEGGKADTGLSFN